MLVGELERRDWDKQSSLFAPFLSDELDQISKSVFPYQAFQAKCNVLGWNGLSETNNQDYSPICNLWIRPNKLERLSLAGQSSLV